MDANILMVMERNELNTVEALTIQRYVMNTAPKVSVFYPEGAYMMVLEYHGDNTYACDYFTEPHASSKRIEFKKGDCYLRKFTGGGVPVHRRN